MSLDLFSCMKSFVAVVEHHNFANAAKHIHLSAPVITKQIKWLENLLEKKLFYRTTRSVQLTEVGSLYLTEVKKIFAQLQAAQNIIKNLEPEPHGDITVAMPTIFNSVAFTKTIHQFLTLYPKITCHIINRGSPTVISDGLADIAITSLDIRYSKIVKENLLTGKRSVYAAPAYIKKHGTPKTLADLKNHNCIINPVVSPHNEWEFDGKKKVTVRGNYYSDSGADIIYAGITGIGLCWIMDTLVAEEVKTGRLVEIKLDAKPYTTHLYLYYRPAPQDSIIRLLAEYLIKNLKR